MHHFTRDVLGHQNHASPIQCRPRARYRRWAMGCSPCRSATIGLRHSRMTSQRSWDKLRRRLRLATMSHLPSFASAEWYTDYNDHRCPHDAWLETVEIAEPAMGKRNELRTTTITV